MIRPDDPRVTAYALGECDETDRLAVDAAMNDDPEVRDAVASVRAAAQAGAEALALDGPVGLTDAQRARVLEAAASGAAAPPVRRPAWRAWAPFAAGFGLSAASLLVVGSLGLANPSPEESARGIAASPLPGPSASPSGRPGFVGRYSRDVARRDLEANGDGIRQGTRPEAGSGGGVGTASETVPFVGTVATEKHPAGPAPVVRFVVPDGVVPGAPPGFVDGALPSSSRAQGYLFVAGDGDVGADLSGFSLPRRTPDVDGPGGEAYEGAVETGFLRVADAPLSTFSVDVDTASYANVRRMIRDGQRPPRDAVRVEEMVNYFRYAYPPPAGADPFAVHVEAATCPWNAKHRLVRVALQGRAIERAARPAMNLVFLLDVSGSMDQPNKLPLVQASMRMLLEELHERDTVAIVVYAGSSGLVLPPTSCEKKAEIQRAIDALRAGGSTNGAAGIQLAYDTARSAFLRGGVNRVVLATDGDFNVGVTSREGLLALIEEQARSGVFLTCLGYGMGNLKDATLEMLADKGNGNYGYVDSTREARKVLVDDASGTLVTIAKDVKIQVEFNPATVAAYRLVGYDDRRLAARDFADDAKDAGEVGAGHAVTAFYEVVPLGGDVPAAEPGEEPLRYGATPAAAPAPRGAADAVARETLTVKMRWKEPDGATSTKREVPFTDGGADYAKASADYRFAAAVAAFALVLKESPHRGTATLEAVAELATDGLARDPGGYRAEFMDLVARARSLLPGR